MHTTDNRKLFDICRNNYVVLSKCKDQQITVELSNNLLEAYRDHETVYFNNKGSQKYLLSLIAPNPMKWQYFFDWFQYRYRSACQEAMIQPLPENPNVA